MAKSINTSIINAFDLSEEELDYELRIRNLLRPESEEHKRERLRNAFKNEQQTPREMIEDIFFVNEWPLLVRKLEEIETGLKADIHVRWISQLRHWKERVHRSHVVDLAQEEQKFEVIRTIDRLMKIYKETAKRLMNLSDLEEDNLELSQDSGSNRKVKREIKVQDQRQFNEQVRFHSSLANQAKIRPGNKLREDKGETIGNYFKNLPNIEHLKINEPQKNFDKPDISEYQGRDYRSLGAIPKAKHREYVETIKEKDFPELSKERETQRNRGKKTKQEKKSKRKYKPKESSSDEESSSLDSLSSLLSSDSSSESEPLESSDRGFGFSRRDERFQHYRLDRWGIQFSGDSQGMDVSDFVFQVNELIVAERIPNDRFLDQAYILFSGEARRWYFTYKKKYKTWNNFSKHLKIRFGDPNKDRKLLQEIKDRKQKKGESFVAFCAEIEGMFERMTKQYSERKRLKVLRNNMRRWYKTKLTFYKIKNIAHLSMLCQQLDKDSGRIYTKTSQPFKKHVRNVEATSESSTSSSDEAEICAFERRDRYERKDRPKYSGARAGDTTMIKETLKEPVALCWNCRKYGHRWRDCKQPKVIFCHACGTPGVTFQTCSRNHVLPQQNPKNEVEEEN